jgi:peptidyl-prolyl cis-trans isomerase C
MPEYSVIEKQVLDRLVQAIVVKKLAAANGVTVDNAEVDDQFNQIAEENGGEDKVSQILSDLYGLSVPTFKRFIKEQLLQEKLKEKFDDDLQLQVKARHILIKVAPDASDPDKEAARAKAQGLLDQINNGADFAEIAKQYSEDEASQGQGGELPYFSKGQNVKEFEEAAFSLEPGEISGLVLTQYGFHIIKVEEKKGTINMTYDEWLTNEEDRLWVIRFVGRDKSDQTASESENGETIQEGENVEGQ